MLNPEFFRRKVSPFTPDVLKVAGLHACEDQSVEACGLVVAGEYQRCENISDEPEAAFEIDPAVYAEAEETGGLMGLIHSHIGGDDFRPSREDAEGQLVTGIPWAIIMPGEAGAELSCHWGLPRPALLRADGSHQVRSFMHLVSDCYSVVQDFYGAVGIELDDMPRAWNWWKRPDVHGSMYLDNLQAQGFDVVSTDPLSFNGLMRPGDGYLMCIGSRVPNHAGVYLGGGLVMDHTVLHGGLSRVTPAAPLVRHMTHLLRHRGWVSAAEAHGVPCDTGQGIAAAVGRVMVSDG